jgi:hypothetical protein
MNQPNPFLFKFGLDTQKQNFQSTRWFVLTSDSSDKKFLYFSDLIKKIVELKEFYYYF